MGKERFISKSEGTAFFIALILFFGPLVPFPLSASPVPSPAQDPETRPFVIGEIVTLPSKILGEDRQIYVYTHPAYDEDDSRYPVAYVLDGEWNFRVASGLIDLLSSREAIPWMIVVGLPNRDREKDLSPSPVKDVPRGGGATAFRRFLREEVFPFVEARYRTEPFRLLIGHSLSGLFTVDTLFSEPGLFNGYLAVSPYLIWDEGRYLDEAVKSRAQPAGPRPFLSVSLGDESRLRPAIERLEEMICRPEGPEPACRFRFWPEEDHETVYPLAVARGLLDIFPDWRLPADAAAAGLDGIRKHYDGLTARYGYEVRPVYFVVNMIGSDFAARGEVDEAIRILRYAVELNPQLPFAHTGLGECYSRKGMIDEAVRSYEKAFSLAPDDQEIKAALEAVKKMRKELITGQVPAPGAAVVRH